LDAETQVEVGRGCGCPVTGGADSHNVVNGTIWVLSVAPTETEQLPLSRARKASSMCDAFRSRHAVDAALILWTDKAAAIVCGLGGSICESDIAECGRATAPHRRTAERNWTLSAGRKLLPQVDSTVGVRHPPVTASTASLIFAIAKCPTCSSSTCGMFGISLATTTASTIAGPSTAKASLIAAFSSPGCRAVNP
jgi:hypothetical protein